MSYYLHASSCNQHGIWLVAKLYWRRFQGQMLLSGPSHYFQHLLSPPEKHRHRSCCVQEDFHFCWKTEATGCPVEVISCTCCLFLARQTCGILVSCCLHSESMLPQSDLQQINKDKTHEFPNYCSLLSHGETKMKFTHILLHLTTGP